LLVQNGWPDPETIEIETLRHEEDQVLCSVTFDEILMEGSECIAGRVSCWGRFRVQLDANGEVVQAELLAGTRDAD
jgi:hypothetical protein